MIGSLGLKRGLGDACDLGVTLDGKVIEDDRHQMHVTSQAKHTFDSALAGRIDLYPGLA